MTKYWRFKEPLEEPSVYAQAGAGDAIHLRLPGGLTVWTPREAVEEVPGLLSMEPPVGTVVLDKDGDAWQRRSRAWHCILYGIESSWEELQGEAPLISLIREPSLEDLEFWCKRIAIESGDAARSLLAYLKADR